MEPGADSSTTELVIEPEFQARADGGLQDRFSTELRDSALSQRLTGSADVLLWPVLELWWDGDVLRGHITRLCPRRPAASAAASEATITFDEVTLAMRRAGDELRGEVAHPPFDLRRPRLTVPHS